MTHSSEIIDLKNKQARGKCIDQARTILGLLENPKNKYDTIALINVGQDIENKIQYLDDNLIEIEKKIKKKVK
jgi:hypothetical protein